MNFATRKSGYEALPFGYGVSDCCLALADWALANGYADGAVELRGQYADEAQMYSLIGEYGDVTDIVEHCALKAGVTRVQRQRLGCIGVIGNADDMYRQWGAIFDGTRWHIRLKTGFTSIVARPLKIWAV